MNKANNKIAVSAIGAVIIFAVIALVNGLMSGVSIRLDMTENKQFTLTDNSKRILGKLDTPITLKFYYSKSSSRLPVEYKNYAQRIEDLLNEFKQVSGGNIEIEKYDPQPDSDAEDAARMDGIQGQMTASGDRIYLGLAITCIDETVALPALSPVRETLLEYDVVRAISRLSQPSKPVVGVMSALPVMGQKPTMQMMQAGQYNKTPAWLAIQELQRDFDLREINMDATEIAKDIDVLFVIHPTGISDATQFAIDQYLLGGGKLIACLDPFSAILAQQAQQNPAARGQESSTMPALLKAWGIEFDANQVVADHKYSLREKGPQGEQIRMSIASLTKDAFNKEDVLTSQLQSILMFLPGGFTGSAVEGLKKESLLTSSKKSALMNGRVASQPSTAFRQFKADDKVYDFSVRLTGAFKSAFPDGKPASKAGDKKDDTKKVAALKEGNGKGVVVLIADSDFMFDQLCFQVQNILGQQIRVPRNSNVSFAQSAIESLAGDTDLIGIRSRQAVRRPFTVVQEMQAEAELKFREEVLKLETELRQAQQRVNQLQARKSKDQRFIISPEQQKEINNLQKKSGEINKELKVLRRTLRGDINSLENMLKFINIALMPILVAFAGIMIAIIRKRRSSAR